MRILNYIFLSSLLLVLPIATKSQETKDTLIADGSFKFRGINISTDLFGYLYSFIEDGTSGEIAVEANFGDRIYPTVEVGYGSIDITDENFGIKYKSAAPFFRAGFNYNFSYVKGKPIRPNYVYGALRFGCSKMDYDVSSPPIKDPVWGGEVPFVHDNISGFASWMELGVGVNVKIWKQFRMGWSVRYKARINVVNSENSNVGYIPGFGKNRHTCFGATYSIIYEIPFK